MPYAEFKKAGFEVDFVTEKGNMPECDSKMLTGMTQKLLVGLFACIIGLRSDKGVLMPSRCQ